MRLATPERIILNNINDTNGALWLPERIYRTDPLLPASMVILVVSEVLTISMTYRRKLLKRIKPPSSAES